MVTQGGEVGQRWGLTLWTAWGELEDDGTGDGACSVK